MQQLLFHASHLNFSYMEWISNLNSRLDFKFVSILLDKIGLDF